MTLTKIDDRGLKTPIDLLDNEKIRLGTGNDLQIYHDGTDNVIEATGNLKIKESGSGTGTSAKFVENGEVELWHNQSKRFETTSFGAEFFGDAGIARTAGGYTFREVTGGGERAGIHSNSSNEIIIKTNGAAEVAKFTSSHLQMNDNKKIQLGTSQDLQLFHDGTDSYLLNYGGYLYVDSGTSDIRFISDGSWANGKMAVFYRNAQVELYYDNTKRFETTSGGTKVYGNLTFADDLNTIRLNDNYKIQLGTSQDLQLYHDGTDSYLQNNNGTLRINNDGTDLVISTDNNIHIRTNGTEEAVKATANGAVELYYDNSKKLETHSTGLNFQGGASNVSVNLKTSNGTTRGSLYANNSNQIGFLDSGGDWALKHENDDSTKFYVQTNLKATIDADGLKFGSDTAAANALDDYEEGEHTITTNSNLTAHSSYNKADYTKVGNMVTVTFLLYVQGVSSNDVVTVSMPFANRNASFPRMCNAVGSVMHKNVNTGNVGMIPFLDAGSSSLKFYNLADDGSWAVINNSDINVGDEMIVTITYKTAT